MATALLSVPTFGNTGLQLSAMLPLTPTMVGGFVGEKELGKSGHSAAVAMCKFYEVTPCVCVVAVGFDTLTQR